MSEIITLQHVGLKIDESSLQCREITPDTIPVETKHIRHFANRCKYCGDVNNKNLCCIYLSQAKDGEEG